jgi:hypothetical protein
MKIGIKLKKLKRLHSPPPLPFQGGPFPFLSIYFGHRIRTWVGIKEVGVLLNRYLPYCPKMDI